MRQHLNRTRGVLRCGAATAVAVTLLALTPGCTGNDEASDFDALRKRPITGNDEASDLDALRKRPIAGHSLLRRALDEVPIPADLHLVREQASGNSLCFDSCSAVVRAYRRTTPFPDTCRNLAAAFVAAGFEVRDGPANSFIAELGGIKAVNVFISFSALEGPSTIHDTELVSLRASSEELGASLPGDDPICPPQ